MAKSVSTKASEATIAGDTQRSRSFDPARFAAITSPIPLLALFGGIADLIIAALVLKAEPRFQPYVIAGAILLPLAWLIVIYRLVAGYHINLYAPRDFSNPSDFLAVISLDTRKTLSGGTLGTASDFAPFKLSENASPKDLAKIGFDIERSYKSDLITNLDPADLLARHAWYNEHDAHSMALQTLLLAIAKGHGASKNYSFASASLRKLGRLFEAKAVASLALLLDRRNVDAQYNLALICKSMGAFDEARTYATAVLSVGAEYHHRRILEEFPG